MGRGYGTKKRKRRAGAIAVILAAALLFTEKTTLLAVESDRDNGIRSVRVADSQIAESTLVIGSYLIDLNGLGDHIYEIAMESASSFSQNRMYYKSELAAGQWFEITDASSIRDITSAGTPVSAAVIEALEFTHRVAANGTVTDLRVQAAVNEFDIPDPYDLMGMEELQPVKIRYQYLQSKETKTESDEKYLQMFEIFYGLSIEDDTTRDCDASLDALNSYKLDVTARKKPGSWPEAVTMVMEGEDARRRVQSLNTLDLYLDELLKKAGGQDQEGLSQEEREAFYNTLRAQGFDEDAIGGSDDDESGGKDGSWYEKWSVMNESYQKFLAGAGTYRGVSLNEEFQVDTDTIAAIGEAKSNVKTSIGKYTGKLLGEGTTASTQAIFRYSHELIDRARASDTSASDGATAALVNLLNILRSVIEDADAERGALESGLTQQALAVWQGILSGGVGEDYRQAAAEGAGQPALTAFLTKRETDADSARLEYQTMLTELWKRMSNSLAQIDAGERLDSLEKLEALPPEDAARKNLLQTVDRHREWLRKSLAQLIADAGDSTALDRLLSEQTALEQKRLDTLDENDLAEAEKLSAKMEAGQNDIADLRQALYRTLTDPNSSEADKTRAAAGLKEGSAGRVIEALADRLTAGILDGADKSGLVTNMTALSELAQYDADAALAAVARIQDVLDDAADTDTGLAEDLNAQLSEIERQAGGDGTGGGMLSQEQLSGLLADYFGDASAASDRDKAGALIALSRYAEDARNQAAKMLAVSMANRLAAEGSHYLYQKYDEAAQAYVSLKNIGWIFGYRYLFDDVHQIVTLQKAQAYYIFTAGNERYSFTEGASGRLSGGPVLQDTLYLDSEDGKRIFGCEGYYVPECSYAAVRTTAMEPVIESVYNRLMEGE